MGAIASQITSLTIVYSTVYSDAYQRKHQSSASLGFVWGIHWGPVNSQHKLEMFPFDDVIMATHRSSNELQWLGWMIGYRIGRSINDHREDMPYYGRYDRMPKHIPTGKYITLRWRHNGRDSVSNHQPYDCLLNRLFRRRSKKTSKLCVTGLCAWNSPRTGEFPAQMASNAENVSIWWRHHENVAFYSF